MTKPIESPVLLIVYNRPDTTRIVFEKIRKVAPRKLYVAADGPRIGSVEDEMNCALVKEVVKKVDWVCDVFYRFSAINQGCGPGPYNAISWVFEYEEQAIILEDDCVPALPFFGYCEDLLNRFKNDTRVWLVSGNQYTEESVNTKHSYFFSKYGHTQGWATWKRSWNQMDLGIEKLPLLLEENLFDSLFKTKKERRYFLKIFSNIFYKKIDVSKVWDTQFVFTLLINNHLAIVPSRNLVRNIGYLGTHSDRKNYIHDRPCDENFKITSHPIFVLADSNYDNHHFNKHIFIKSSLMKRIMKKFLNSLGITFIK